MLKKQKNSILINITSFIGVVENKKKTLFNFIKKCFLLFMPKIGLWLIFRCYVFKLRLLKGVLFEEKLKSFNILVDKNTSKFYEQNFWIKKRFLHPSKNLFFVKCYFLMEKAWRSNQAQKPK